LYGALSMYGEPLTWGYEMAYKNIMNELPEKFMIDFDNMVTGKGRLNLSNFRSSWSRGKEDIRGIND